MAQDRETEFEPLNQRTMQVKNMVAGPLTSDPALKLSVVVDCWDEFPDGISVYVMEGSARDFRRLAEEILRKTKGL